MTRIATAGFTSRRACFLALGMFILMGTAQHVALASGFPARVLITNDNGMDDPKIVALARAFAAHSETWVVAPDVDRSGSGNYLTFTSSGGLTVAPRDLGPGIRAYAVDGFPADCVLLALTALMVESPPDLVISGINGGPNLGVAWMFSGTIGAARVAALAERPAIAVSGLDDDLPGAVEAAVQWVLELAKSPVVQNMETGTYLTVSLPRTTPDAIRGVRIVDRAPPLQYPQLTEVSDNNWRVTGVTKVDAVIPEDSDQAAYEAGYIAVVPMRATEIDHAMLQRWRATPPKLPRW